MRMLSMAIVYGHCVYVIVPLSREQCYATHCCISVCFELPRTVSSQHCTTCAPNQHNTTAISLAASPSPPGWSSGRVAKPHAEGGEGLANIALDHISLECQLHVPVNR